MSNNLDIVKVMVGDSGSGGEAGLVPAPASGDAAAGKFLKADGTFAVPSGGGGGLTEITETLETTSPNNTVNAESLQVTGGTTNTDLVLGPKGTGAFILGPPPDGSTPGGNKRGTYTIDLQTARSAADQVGTGSRGVLLGSDNKVPNDTSVAIGYNNLSGQYLSNATAIGVSNISNGIAIGDSNTSQGSATVTIGTSNTATSGAPFGIAVGLSAQAHRWGMFAYSAGLFSATGDAQFTCQVLRRKTTTNSAVTLFADNSSTYCTIPSGKILACVINICGIKSDGTAAAHYVRQYAIKNVGGTTSEVYAAVTLGTDTAAGTSIAISADDTNDALKIEVTGITSETWRWVATVEGVEIGYGS